LQPLVPAGNGLDRDCVVLCNAPRAFVPSRFLRYLGAASDETLNNVIQARAVIEGWDD